MLLPLLVGLALGAAGAQQGPSVRPQPLGPQEPSEGIPSPEVPAPGELSQPLANPVLDRDELLAFLEDRAAREAPAEVLAERLDQVLRVSLERWERVQDYQGLLDKRERIKGKLHPAERLQVKYKLPSSQYLRWIRGEKTGREILYADDLNQGRMMRVLPAFFPMIPDQIQRLAPGCSAALEGTLHPHTSYRVGDVLERFLEHYLRARLAEPLAEADGALAEAGGTGADWTCPEGLGELDAIRYRGKRRLHKGTRCYVFDLWFPYRDAGGGPYPFRQVVVGFDPESLLLVVLESYRAQPQVGDRQSIPVRRAVSSEESFYATRVRELDLQDSYHFQQLEVDQGLPEEHFSPTNPEYGFRHLW